ncbi:hypothetical protein [Arsenophonus nasoniae]|uniref:hypothetical protein n=1 Tax=Arsenophonus nasoniae TaxID=638 RepID=UPI0010838CC7|nr:hypothetical protein [Arsenophonus nasoniae]
MRFLNKTGDGFPYRAFIRVHGIDEAAYIDSDKDFVTVGKILDDNMQHVAHLVIYDRYNLVKFNTATYFEYNATENQIEVNSDTLPLELEFERVDGFRFNLLLKNDD